MPDENAEGILTGIGFLGAGAIVRSRDSDRVIGTATGVSVSASGGLGMTLGFGFSGLAAIGLVPVLGPLVVLGYVMPQITDEHDDGEK